MKLNSFPSFPSDRTWWWLIAQLNYQIIASAMLISTRGEGVGVPHDYIAFVTIFDVNVNFHNSFLTWPTVTPTALIIDWLYDLHAWNPHNCNITNAICFVCIVLKNKSLLFKLKIASVLPYLHTKNHVPQMLIQQLSLEHNRQDQGRTIQGNNNPANVSVNRNELPLI